MGDWALRWTEGNEALQVAFVMFIFPVIMNATQYYIVDSFIKNQKPDGVDSMEEDGNEDGYISDGYENRESGSSDEIHSGDEDEELLAKAELAKEVTRKTVKKSKTGSSSRNKSSLKTGNKDYDPLVDGDNAAGGTSTSK